MCIAVAAFSAATAYEARTVSIADTHYADGLASSFDLVFGAGNVTNALYAAYGTFDGGADPKAWQNLVKITDIAPETSAYTVSAPAGWGTSVNALRFFMADIEQGPYDYSVEYIASTGADQGIDTGRHLFYGETFTLVWRQYALTGLTAEDKGWGAGTSGDKNITGGGRRNNNRLRTYIRRGHRDFSPVFPTSDLTTNVIYRDVCAVTDPISSTRTALDGENAGSVWTLADTLTPYSGTSYDSAANIYLFRDYQNPYWGKKAIYRATLLDVNGDLAFDFIPVSLNGKLCFYDKVSGAYKYNLGATSFESGPQVGAKRGEIGASSATAPVFSTVLPVLALIPEITARADGTATIPFILSSAGAGAAAADVIYRVGYAPDALGAETVAVASASPGPGSFTLSGLAPGRVCYVSAYASSSAGDSAVQGPVAFMTPESGATGRTFAMTATNRVSGAIVSVDITYSASAEPARLFMAYGATDGGDDPYDWDGLKYVCDVAPYAFSQTVAVPAGWGDDVQAMRLFLTGMPAGYDRELEYIASTGAQGIDTGRHLLFGDIFTLDWRQYDLTGLNSEDKGWGTGTANANYIAGGGRRSFSNVKTYICNNNNDFSPVFKTSDLSTEVRYRDVCAVTNPITYTMTALDGAAAGTVWTAPTVAKTSYDSSVNIFLFRGAGTS
ncbi:MAG: hypothetical protein IJK04_02685, partial [Kiritimatiellae bacterium]|nr:hypothetical protein [Kiritimatiellia bacterium]